MLTRPHTGGRGLQESGCFLPPPPFHGGGSGWVVKQKTRPSRLTLRRIALMSAAMIVLGLETSCDETAAALVDAERRIFGETILSQLDEHPPYGCVVPEIAARRHLEQLDRL